MWSSASQKTKEEKRSLFSLSLLSFSKLQLLFETRSLAFFPSVFVFLVVPSLVLKCCHRRHKFQENQQQQPEEVSCWSSGPCEKKEDKKNKKLKKTVLSRKRKTNDGTDRQTHARTDRRNQPGKSRSKWVPQQFQVFCQPPHYHHQLWYLILGWSIRSSASLQDPWKWKNAVLWFILNWAWIKSEVSCQSPSHVVWLFGFDGRHPIWPKTSPPLDSLFIR